jgi:hypothetical protein
MGPPRNCVHWALCFVLRTFFERRRRHHCAIEVLRDARGKVVDCSSSVTAMHVQSFTPVMQDLSPKTLAPRPVYQACPSPGTDLVASTTNPRDEHHQVSLLGILPQIWRS